LEPEQKTSQQQQWSFVFLLVFALFS